MTKNADNQKALKERRQSAYKLLKQLAMESGVMQRWKDSEGYDEFIGLLESGEFVLKLEAKQED